MLPDEPGTYALILRACRSTILTVGKLGDFVFPTGWYAYAGSARGPGGLASRVSRHVAVSKTCHWHVDYLREEVELVEIWYATGLARRECSWADALSALGGASIPAPRFGASDCRCAAHLIHFAERPSLLPFSESLKYPVMRGVLRPGAKETCQATQKDGPPAGL